MENMCWILRIIQQIFCFFHAYSECCCCFVVFVRLLKDDVIVIKHAADGWCSICSSAFHSLLDIGWKIKHAVLITILYVLSTLSICVKFSFQYTVNVYQWQVSLRDDRQN